MLFLRLIAGSPLEMTSERWVLLLGFDFILLLGTEDKDRKIRRSTSDYDSDL